MTTPGSFTEWCIYWGAEDPNDCPGLLIYDDQEDAEDHLPFIPGSRVACRTVTRGTWSTVDAKASTS